MTTVSTSSGIAAGTLIYEVLRLHGQLLAAGDALMADLGLTSARWQVLGTIAASKASLTVPDLARILGQSRQSIQRLANEMNADGLVGFVANPGHRRSMFVVPTEAGRRLHAQVEARRIPWTETIAERLDGADVEQAARTLAALRAILERQQAV
jgi:DNA-binding MarR family transcriptional regulator